MPVAIEPNEDQTGVDVIVSGGLPADGRDLGAAADTGDTARAEEAQTAQEEVTAALSDEETRNRADLETRRSTRTLKDITARQKDLRVIGER
jgi:hypothetical protein